MKILSLNVGTPRPALWNGKTVMTGIFKTPVSDRRRIVKSNIEGDEQADLRVHGGVDKAIYAYDITHYTYWKTQLERNDWPMGLFGENLTTEGLPDDEVRIGDIFRMGTALLQAIQPRFPCYKLNIRFDRTDMIDRFFAGGRHGIYFRILEEGTLQAGDPIELIERPSHEVTIADVAASFSSRGADPELLAHILALPYLPEGLRKNFLGFR